MPKYSSAQMALAREVSPGMTECELTFLEREPIDLALARAQHERYCQILEEQGLKVVRIEAASGCPDSCFIEDAAVVVDEVAILTMMGAPSRRGESAGVAQALAPYRQRVARMELPATMDGGDVLQLGRVLYVGLSARTNAAGVAFLSKTLSPFGYEVFGVETKGCLHLKTAASMLASGRVLVNPQWVDAGILKGVTCLEVPPEEPWAANVLKIGDAILVHQGFEGTIRLLRAEGFSVIPLDVSEFLKAEAGLTCKSIVFSA